MQSEHNVSVTPTEAERAAMRDAVERALTAASESGKAGITATVMQGDAIITTGENEVHLQSDPTKHAEMVAITRAAAALDRPDLTGCTIISTLQPSEMCLAAIRFAVIDRIICRHSRPRRRKVFCLQPFAHRGFSRTVTSPSRAAWMRTTSFTFTKPEKNSVCQRN